MHEQLLTAAVQAQLLAAPVHEQLLTVHEQLLTVHEQLLTVHEQLRQYDAAAHDDDDYAAAE